MKSSKILTSEKSVILSSAVRELRKTRGLNVAEFAVLVGVSVDHIRSIESGRGRPSVELMLKLADAAPSSEPAQDILAIVSEKTGIALGRLEASARRARLVSAEDNANAQALRAYDDAATGLNLLYDLAAEGDSGALEVLKHIADDLTTKPGDWQTMKYVKKLKR